MDDTRAQLFASYLDGTLDETGVERLALLVRTDDNAALELLELSETDALLRGRRKSDRAVLIQAVRDRIEQERGDIVQMRERVRARIAAETPVKSRRRSRATMRARRAPTSIPPSAVIAAAVLFVMTGMFLLLQRSSPERPRTARPSEPAAPVIDSGETGPKEIVRQDSVPPTFIERSALPKIPPTPRRTHPVPERHTGPSQEIPPLPPAVEDATPRRPHPPTAVASPSESVGRIDTVIGYVRYRRASATRWNKAVPGVPLDAGDQVDTRAGKLRVALADGTLVYMNANTLAAIDDKPGAQIRVEKGEIYCDVRKQPSNRPFGVETNDGAITVLGTRFGVRKLSTFSEVLVESGLVRVANEKGSVDVGASRATKMSRGRKPAVPTSARFKRVRVWLAALNPKKSRPTTQVLGARTTDADLARWSIYDDANGSLKSRTGGVCSLTSTIGQVGAVAPRLKPASGEILSTFRYDGDKFVAIVFRFQSANYNLRWRLRSFGAQFAYRKPGSGSMVVRGGNVEKSTTQNNQDQKAQYSGPGLVRGKWHHVRVAFNEKGGKLHMAARWWLNGRTEPRAWMLTESIDAAAVPGPGAIGIHSGGAPLQIQRLDFIGAK